MIPSIKKCFSLMEKYEMLDNIKDHSIVVAKIAKTIANGLNEAAIGVSVEKTIVGALLHDIGKTPCLNTRKDHAEVGRKICLDNNLDEIAPMVGEHVRLKNYNLNGKYSEREIIYYSDKRVNHDKIVSLEERLDYIIYRYSGNQEIIRQAIEKNFELCKKVEEKLFKNLTFGPKDLPKFIKNVTINEQV